MKRLHHASSITRQMLRLLRSLEHDNREGVTARSTVTREWLVPVLRTGTDPSVIVMLEQRCGAAQAKQLHHARSITRQMLRLFRSLEHDNGEGVTARSTLTREWLVPVLRAGTDPSVIVLLEQRCSLLRKAQDKARA